MMPKIREFKELIFIIFLWSCSPVFEVGGGPILASFDCGESKAGTYLVVELENVTDDTVAMILSGFIMTKALNYQTTGSTKYDTEIIISQGDRIVSSKDIMYNNHIYVHDHPSLYLLSPHEPVSIFIIYFGDFRRDFELDWRPFEVQVVLHPTTEFMYERVEKGDSTFIRNNPQIQLLDTAITSTSRMIYF